MTQSTTQQSQPEPDRAVRVGRVCHAKLRHTWIFHDSIDYGPFKDGEKVYYGGTGAWNTLVDVGETGLQSTRNGCCAVTRK